MHSGVTCTVVFLSILLRMTEAGAMERPVVEIWTQEGFEGLESRIRAELSLTGFRVRERQRPATVTLFSATSWPHGHDGVAHTGAQARVQCLVEAGVVEVTVLIPEKAQVWRVSLPVLPEDEAVVALAVSEKLWVTLFSAFSVVPDESEVAVTKPASRQQRSVRGALGPGALWASLDTPPVLGVFANLDLQLTGLVGLELRGMIPLTTATIDGSEARAGLRTGGVALGPRIRWEQKVVQPVVSMGYAIWFVRSVSVPAEGFVGSGDFQVVGGPYVHLGISVMFGRRVGICFSGIASLSIPPIRYRMADRDVAVVGRPILGGMVGVVVRMGK